MIELEDLLAALRGPSRGDPALDAVRELVATPPGDLVADAPVVTATRASPLTSYAAVWTLFHAKGARVAAVEARAGLDNHRGLPAPWAANLRFILATDALLGGDEQLLDAGSGAAGTRTTVTGREHLGLMTFSVLVNGHSARFALDTGAPTTVVSAGLATRGHIRQAPEAARQVSDGSGHLLQAIPAAVAELQVGELVRRPAAATVLELPPELGLDGLLSPWDFARDLDVEIDATARSLRLRKPPAGARLADGADRALPLHWVEGVPRVEVRVGERTAITTQALLDSGAVTNLLCSDLATRLGHSVTGTLRGIGARGSVNLRQAGRLSVQVSEAETEHMLVAVKPCASDPSALVGEPAGVVLGLPWLRRAPLRFPARRDVARMAARPA